MGDKIVAARVSGRLAVVLAVLILLLWSVPCPATEYFITTKFGTGSGTAIDPFGLADLPSSSNANMLGKAMQALQPGDTLTFRGGDYNLNTVPGSYYWLGYLRPAQSGQPGKPITIQGEPGETVRLINAGGGQPLLGTRSIADQGINYVTFRGFYLQPGGAAAMRLGGAYDELSWSDVQGIYVSSSDNHDGIRVENASNSLIQHNNIHGVLGLSENSAGIKLYKSSNIVARDNYVHNNTAGIFDKDSGTDNAYRRNYFTGNSTHFYGNNQGTPARYDFSDNVVDGGIELHYLSNGVKIHDNLFRNSTLSDAWAGQVWNTSIWNNVVLGQGSSDLVFHDPQSPLVTTGSNPHFAYLDHNVYAAAPQYKFGEYVNQPQTLTLANMRTRNFEIQSAVATPGSIYADQTSWDLLAPWTTAGRYGDGIGPDNVALVLDTARYGPAGWMDSIIPGDANLDGKVDSTDRRIWLLNYDPLQNNSDCFTMGDFNRDGKIDSADRRLWLLNYDPIGAVSSPETIPEPATLTLLVLGLGRLSCIRRPR